jgi:hypothetical protein
MEGELQKADILRSYVLNNIEFAILKLGNDCNADKAMSFTEAKCCMETIKAPSDASLTLTVPFTRVFRPGISLLKDYIEGKSGSFSDYENKAIKKLVGFLKDKGNSNCLKTK